MSRTQSRMRQLSPRFSSPEVRAVLPLWVLSGALFILYPALRPYSSEVGMAEAIAFASDRWVISHLAAMVAFGCLAAGCYSLTGTRLVRFDALAKSGLILGVGLILPYYGAETFGLHAIGTAAMQGDTSQLAAMTDSVRYNPTALVMFAAGWIVLAIAGVALARALWARGIRVAAVLVGIGLVLYLPQFFGSPWIRIVHGMILGIGLIITSIQLTRATSNE